jgi:ferric-dicitrate binding protein FerR (iron transport regulator)
MDNRLTILWQRYLSNTCTREELEELLAATDDEQLHQQLWLDSKDAPGIPDAATKLEAMLAATRPQRKIRWWPYAAAAVTIGMIAWLLYLKPVPPQPAPLIAKIKTDIQAGTNKATLTLADGSTIALDSIGTLQQGATTIRRKPGILQYAAQGKQETVSFNTLSTPRGGQYQVMLPDGSKVWLNAASRLKYPTAFIGKERIVELEGQAYFEIAKNAHQPFKVHVNGSDIQVLGTSFDVMAYPDEKTTNTTLLEGAVKVADKILKPGQQAAVSGSDINIRQVNTDDAIAWKNGYFSFRDADLPTVMRQLSRWYDVTISYHGAIPQGTFSGEIGRTLSLEQALQILEQTRVHFNIEGRQIVILP